MSTHKRWWVLVATVVVPAAAVIAVLAVRRPGGDPARLIVGEWRLVEPEPDSIPPGAGAVHRLYFVPVRYSESAVVEVSETPEWPRYKGTKTGVGRAVYTWDGTGAIELTRPNDSLTFSKAGAKVGRRWEVHVSAGELRVTFGDGSAARYARVPGPAPEALPSGSIGTVPAGRATRPAGPRTDLAPGDAEPAPPPDRAGGK